tara:strand:+ start:1050 stop:3089 length:2040 start_codon:yes stop_codon:yes gene_type:complete
MSPSPQEYKVKSWTLISTGILFAGTFLRFYTIDAPLISDELASASIWAQMPYAQIPVNYQFPNNHIFHTLLISFLLKTFGPYSFIIRMPVLIAGVASLILTFLCALRITANWAAAVAALTFTAFAASPVYYSSNARGYALLMVFALLTMWWLHPFLISIKSSVSDTIEKASWPIYFGLFLVWSLGTWTVPTFVYFEGMLAIWLFGALLLSQESNRLVLLKIFIILLIAIGLFFVQYFVIIQPEMLKVAISNAAASTSGKFFPQLLNEWTRPWEFCGLLFIALAWFGVTAIVQRSRRLGLALVATIVLPPFLGWFVGSIGLTKSVPDPRVFHYCIPFFYMAVATGLAKAANWSNETGGVTKKGKNSGFSNAAVVIILTLTALWSIKDFVVRVLPSYQKREPYNEVQSFIKSLGPRDLVLTSSKHHVWFYLYGADEMRKRVESILDVGRLDSIYFMVSLKGPVVDAKWIEKKQERFLEIRGLPLVQDSSRSVENFSIPEKFLQLVRRTGSISFFKVRQRLIRQTSRLMVPSDGQSWIMPENLKDNLIYTRSGAELHFRDSFYMLKKETNETESPAGQVNIFLLRSRISESGRIIFSNSRKEAAGVVFDPTWRGNALVMDHPYGPSIFNKLWQSSIYISRDGANRPMLAAYNLKEDVWGEVDGLTSYSISSDGKLSFLKGKR